MASPTRARARAEPCNLNGICQSNNTCFCQNGFATCAPLDTTNGCETNVATDVNKRAPAPRRSRLALACIGFAQGLQGRGCRGPAHGATNRFWWTAR